MKFLSIFFVSILFLSLSQCKPFSLDDENGNRDKDKDGKISDRLRDIDLSETGKDLLEDCTTHAHHVDFSLIPGNKELQNCLSKAIDDGLKPLCDREKELKELLKNPGDNDRDEIETELEIIEEEKYILTDDIYAIADTFDDLANEVGSRLGDRIDRQVDKADAKDNWAKALGFEVVGVFTDMAITTELDSYTRLVDSKARRACSTINFSKIRSKSKRKD